jgi:histidinol-phosphate phosphatase family protein
MKLRLSPGSALFLDRDGVINQRLVGAYVRHPGEFAFLPGVREALTVLRPAFCRVVVATNQQGIGKGLMTEADLALVHAFMLAYLNEHAVLIDRVYHCPALAEANHPDRKPAPGMAHRAKADFPEIDLATSLMVGDAPSDMWFGQRAGMKTLFFGQEDDQGAPVHFRGRDWAEVCTWWASQGH